MIDFLQAVLRLWNITLQNYGSIMKHAIVMTCHDIMWYDICMLIHLLFLHQAHTGVLYWHLSESTFQSESFMSRSCASRGMARATRNHRPRDISWSLVAWSKNWGIDRLSSKCRHTVVIGETRSFLIPWRAGLHATGIETPLHAYRIDLACRDPSYFKKSGCKFTIT